MRAHRSIAAGFVIAALTAGTARAAPDYSAPLPDAIRDQARVEIARFLQRAGKDPARAPAVIAHNLVVTSSDTGCPNVDVDVVNATKDTMWNVEVEIRQQTTEQHVDTIHLPYLTSGTLAHVQVACVRDYGTLSSGGIQLGYHAQARPLSAEVLAALSRGKADYDRHAQYVWPATERTTRSLLVAALELEDPEVAAELVFAIADTGTGLDELAAELTRRPNGSLASALADAFDAARPAARSVLARALLASPGAERWTAPLTAMIDGPLCHGKREDAVRLWLQARGATTVPVAALRARIAARCQPVAGDGAVLAAALDREPARAADVLDAVDPALFDAAVASWKSSPSDGSPGLIAYLRDSRVAARFDRAAAELPRGLLSVALGQVVRASDGPAIAHQVAWLAASLDRATKLDDAVRAVTEALVRGEVPAAVMHDAVRAAGKRAPAAAHSAITDHAERHPIPFDVAKLDPAIDAGELYAWASATLTGCGASLAAVRACAQAVAHYRDATLVKTGGAALRTEFVNTLHDLGREVADPPQLIALAGDLTAAGWPIRFLADRLCLEAQVAGDSESRLATAAAIDPQAPCITAAHAAVVHEHRKAIWLAVFAIVGLVVPIPAGGLLLRRRYRALKRDLAPAVAAAPASRDALADRLGDDRLGRGLAAALADAARELAGTPAGTAAAAIDRDTLTAAAATVNRAVRASDAATLLVRRPDDAIYVVALPVRDARPQVVERYLGATWPEHAAAIQRAAERPVLALVVLCGSEAREATVVVGFTPAPDGPGAASDPDALLDARVARERGANRFRHVIALAATPSGEA